MGFKFWCQVGGGEHYFWNYNIHVTFQIFGSKLVIFLSVFLCILPFWRKIQKPFYHSKLKKLLVPSLSPFFLFFIEFILFFARTSANNEEVTASIDFLPTPTMSLWGPAQDLRRVWWGRVRTGYQKYPLIFFILCKYIDKVYTYLDL